MRVLIDTNIVLDFLPERDPFVENAARLFERIDAGEIEGFIAATTITNIAGGRRQMADGRRKSLVLSTPVPLLGETTAVAPLGETPRPHCLPKTALCAICKSAFLSPFPFLTKFFYNRQGDCYIFEAF